MKCPLCELSIEKMSLNLHYSSCEKRDKYCNFCNLYIKYNEYSEHVYACSSRSQLCPYCKKYIVMRDFEYHMETIHDNGLLEGPKGFDSKKGGLYRLDFSSKNPFYQEKIKKAFNSQAMIVRKLSEEIKPLDHKEEDIEIMEGFNENFDKKMKNGSQMHLEINEFINEKEENCKNVLKKEEEKSLAAEKKLFMSEKKITDDKTIPISYYYFLIIYFIFYKKKEQRIQGLNAKQNISKKNGFVRKFITLHNFF